MIRETLTHFQFPALTCVGLLIFFLFFIAQLFWVFRKQGKLVYSEIEQLPLDSERPRNAQSSLGETHHV